MSRKKLIIILIIVVLVTAIVLTFLWFEKEKNKFKGESFTTGEDVVTEQLSLIGKISTVNTENNFLMVMPVNTEREVKVIVSDAARLIKLEAPFLEDSPPPAGTQFVPGQKEITLSDFKEGDNVLVMTGEDITGKSEIDNVNFIQISL